MQKTGADTMIDGHMHLEYGELSIEYVMEFINEAVKKGLTHIQILDHTHRFKEFKPIYENLRVYPQQDKWLNNPDKKFKNTLDEYMQLIQTIKTKNLPIKVSFGLEVCYVPGFDSLIKEILEPYTFDFLVGAIHSIDDKLYDMPFSQEILWNVYDADTIYQRYYELVFELIESDLFTQLAHPDTIKMFQIYPSYDLTPTYHKLAELLNKHHMKTENNTGCYYRYHHPDVGLSKQLYEILLEHNVEIIPASDAHHPEHVGHSFHLLSKQ